MSRRLIPINCPYCGRLNNYTQEVNPYGGQRIVTCDMDAGGCDKRFVLEYEVSVNAKALKIQGQD